jgi:hypothetical protein
MIITGGSQSFWRKLDRTLMKPEDDTRVRLVETRGLATDDVTYALRIMDALGMGTCAKRVLYHATINPRAEESLTERQWEKAADTLEHALGLYEQPRIVVEHEKSGRVYRHVVWSRVDFDTMTMIPDSWSYLAHQRTAAALEKEFGHKVTPRNLRDGDHRTTERWSDEEYAQIVAEADRAGLTVASHMRSRATGVRPRPSAAMAKFAKMLADADQAAAVDVITAAMEAEP